LLKSISTQPTTPSPLLLLAISSAKWAVASGSDSAISNAQNKASQEEKNAANASTNLSNTISSNMNQTFANSQAIQGGLNAQLQTLTNQGLAGKGFQNGEEANLRSDSDEQSAQQNVKAEAALNQRNAGGEEGGAATSGAVGSNDALLANAAAAQNASAQRNITGENATLARQNVQSGLSGLGSLSGQETSQADSLGGQAVGASGQSFKEQTQAYQPSTFWSGLGSSVLGMGLNAIAPGAGSLVSGLTTANTGGQPTSASQLAAYNNTPWT
jgi:hypothetical protein